MNALLAVALRLLGPNLLWLVPWWWQTFRIIASGDDKACVAVWSLAFIYAIPVVAIVTASVVHSAEDLGVLVPDDLDPAAPFLAFAVHLAAFLLPFLIC